MKYISVDIEADGPCPALYSMVSFGAVELDSGKTFYAELKPISDNWIPEALAVSGFTRPQCATFQDPKHVMVAFNDWIHEVSKGDRVRMVADNPAFDWGFINYYFHAYLGKNPFGWSCVSLTSLYHGLEGSMFKSFKHLRKTKHTHNALEDAQGNAEVIQVIRQRIKGL